MDARHKLKRKNLMLFAGGITGRFSFESLWDQEFARVLRQAFRTRCYFVDYRRRLKRYLRYYPNPAAEQHLNYDHALSLGYPKDNLFEMDHDEQFILQKIEEKEIDAIVVASYGHAIEKSIIDAVHGNCFIVHPVRPLPPRAKRIPIHDRGSAIVENAVRNCEKKVKFQIAMIRAEPVVNPNDPADWDKGKIVVQGQVFKGPEFSPDELGDDDIRLGRRVIRTQAHIASHYGPVLDKLISVLNFSPEELVEAGVSKKRVIYDLGFTPRQIIKAELLGDLKTLMKKKKKKKRRNK